jgi:hypothetical protein
MWTEKTALLLRCAINSPALRDEPQLVVTTSLPPISQPKIYRQINFQWQPPYSRMFLQLSLIFRCCGDKELIHPDLDRSCRLTVLEEEWPYNKILFFQRLEKTSGICSCFILANASRSPVTLRFQPSYMQFLLLCDSYTDYYLTWTRPNILLATKQVRISRLLKIATVKIG